MTPATTHADDPALRAAIERLLADYARCLDDGDFARWPSLFTDDASYSVQQAEDVERGLLVGLMVDSNHARIRDRVRFITEVWKGAVEAYRTRHFHQILAIEPLPDAGTWLVDSNLLVTFTPVEGCSAVLASGRSSDEVRFTDTGPRLRRRAVVLDGIPARALNYPL